MKPIFINLLNIADEHREERIYTFFKEFLACFAKNKLSFKFNDTLVSVVLAVIANVPDARLFVMEGNA